MEIKHGLTGYGNIQSTPIHTRFNILVELRKLKNALR